MLTFKKNKILNLISGIVIAIIGFYICFHPLDMIVILSLYLGIIFIIIGSIYMVEYYKYKHWRYINYGLLNLIFGILMITKSNFVATIFIILIGLWVLLSSITQIITAIQFRKLNISFWIYLFVSGSIGILFSFLILYRPLTSIITITVIIGTYMIIYGLIDILEYFILEEKNEKIL